MATSPTQYVLRELRKQGYLCQVTEHWNPFARIRQDLFGFVDVLAIKDGETLAVQATSRSNVPARVRKIAEHENIGSVREAGWVIQVWGVDKCPKSKKLRARIVDVS